MLFKHVHDVQDVHRNIVSEVPKSVISEDKTRVFHEPESLSRNRGLFFEEDDGHGGSSLDKMCRHGGKSSLFSSVRKGGPVSEINASERDILDPEDVQVCVSESEVVHVRASESEVVRVSESEVVRSSVSESKVMQQICSH